MSKDGIHIQYALLKAQLKGINPKLSIYQKIKSEMEALEKQGASDGFKLYPEKFKKKFKTKCLR